VYTRQATLVGILLAALPLEPLFAQALVSGRVVDHSGNPLSDVEARLAVKNLSATTDTDGTFEIQADATLAGGTPTGLAASTVQMHNGMFRVAAGFKPARVSAWLFDGRGRVVSVVFEGFVAAGATFAAPVFPKTAAVAQGFYVLQYVIDGSAGRFEICHLGHPGSQSFSVAMSPGLAKGLAAPDTLELSFSGCATKAIPLDGYGTDLGDVLLSCNLPRPPKVPQSYTLPTGGIRVTNSAGLLDALSGGTARDIVLADGTYDNGEYFHPNAPHRFWAEHLGGATLKAGLMLDKGEGAQVHGLRLDVNSDKKGYESAIIHTGRTGNGLKVMDCFFEGNGIMELGILARAVHGLVFQRLVMRDFQHDGIRITSYPNDVTPSPGPHLSDLDIANVKDPDPGCCNGTSEDGILLMNGDSATLVERVRVRNVDWMGVSTSGWVRGGRWRDIDLDSSFTGFYIEHGTNNIILERFHIGSRVQEGIAFEGGNEWSHYAGVGENIVVQDGVDEAYQSGVNISVCNKNETIQRVVFKGQCFAAISNWATHPFGTCTGEEGATNKFIDNDYSGIDPGAEAVTLKWTGSASCK